MRLFTAPNQHCWLHQVCQADGEVIITNDGATILNKMTVTQPAAKMLVELAKSQVCCFAAHFLQFLPCRLMNLLSPLQDVVAGDGTTSVTVICGALLKKCLELLERGVHPTIVSDSFNKAAERAVQVRQLLLFLRICKTAVTRADPCRFLKALLSQLTYLTGRLCSKLQTRELQGSLAYCASAMLHPLYKLKPCGCHDLDCT